MSADNGYFVFRTADGRFGVVHHLLSGMPSEIPEIVAAGRTCLGDELAIHATHGAALHDAQDRYYRARADGDIVEYGIVDLSDESYDEMMAPYLAPPGDEDG
jgi:hypothetical protein